MSEDLKIGGVSFGVNFDESSVIQAFENIRKAMQENSNNAERILRTEMSKIEAVLKSTVELRKSYDEEASNNLVDSFNKSISTLKGKLESLGKEMKIEYTLDATDVFEEYKKLGGNIEQTTVKITELEDKLSMSKVGTKKYAQLNDELTKTKNKLDGLTAIKFEIDGELDLRAFAGLESAEVHNHIVDIVDDFEKFLREKVSQIKPVDVTSKLIDNSQGFDNFDIELPTKEIAEQVEKELEIAGSQVDTSKVFDKLPKIEVTPEIEVKIEEESLVDEATAQKLSKYSLGVIEKAFKEASKNSQLFDFSEAEDELTEIDDVVSHVNYLLAQTEKAVKEFNETTDDVDSDTFEKLRKNVIKTSDEFINFTESLDMVREKVENADIDMELDAEVLKRIDDFTSEVADAYDEYVQLKNVLENKITPDVEGVSSQLSEATKDRVEIERDLSEAIKLRAEATKLLADAENKAVAPRNKLAEAEKKLADARRKIADAEDKIVNAEVKKATAQNDAEIKRLKAEADAALKLANAKKKEADARKVNAEAEKGEYTNRSNIAKIKEIEAKADLRMADVRVKEAEAEKKLAETRKKNTETATASAVQKRLAKAKERLIDAQIDLTRVKTEITNLKRQRNEEEKQQKLDEQEFLKTGKKTYVRDNDEAYDMAKVEYAKVLKEREQLEKKDKERRDKEERDYLEKQARQEKELSEKKTQWNQQSIEARRKKEEEYDKFWNKSLGEKEKLQKQADDNKAKEDEARVNVEARRKKGEQDYYAEQEKKEKELSEKKSAWNLQAVRNKEEQEREYVNTWEKLLLEQAEKERKIEQQMRAERDKQANLDHTKGKDSLSFKKQELEIQQRLNDIQAKQNSENLKHEQTRLKLAQQLEDIQERQNAVIKSPTMSVPEKTFELTDLGVESKRIALAQQEVDIMIRGNQLEAEHERRMVSIGQEKLKLERAISNVNLALAKNPDNERLQERKRELELARLQLGVKEQQADVEVQSARQAIISEREQLRIQEQQLDTVREQNRVAKQTYQTNKKQNQDLKNDLSELSQRASALGVASGVIMSALAGKNLYELFIGNAANYERMVNSFGLLINDVSRAKLVMDELRQLAYETPYSVLDMTNTANTLAATDLYVSEIEDLIPRLGDLARGDGNKLKMITKATMDIVNAGKVMGEELNQLKDVGVPIIPEMAKMLGVTNAQFRKMVEMGQVSSDVYLETVKQLTSEGGKFYGLMDSFSKDYLGRLEQVKSKFMELGMEVGNNVLGDLTEYLEDILVKFDEMEADGSLDALIEDWGQLLKTLAEMANSIAVFVGNNPKLVNMTAQLAVMVTLLGAMNIAFSTAKTTLTGLWSVMKVASRVRLFDTIKNSAVDATRAVGDLTMAIDDNVNSNKKKNDEDNKASKGGKGGKKGASDDSGSSFVPFISGGVAGIVAAVMAVVGGVSIKALWDDVWEDFDKSKKELEEFNKELEKTPGTLQKVANILSGVSDQYERLNSGDFALDISKLEASIIGLQEVDLTTSGVLSEESLARQTDYVNNLKDMAGLDVSIIEYDAETKKIKNLDEVLSEVINNLNNGNIDGLIGNLREKLEAEKEFYIKVTPKMEDFASNPITDMLTKERLEEAYGREIQNKEFSQILLTLDDKGYRTTFTDLMKYQEEQIGWAELGVKNLEKDIIESVKNVSTEIKTQTEEIKKDVTNAIETAERLNEAMDKLGGSSEFEVLVTVPDEELIERWKILEKVLVEGGENITSELTKKFTDFKLIDDSETYSADLKEYLANTEMVIEEITAMLLSGEITYSQYTDSLTFVRKKNEETLSEYRSSMGRLGISTQEFNKQVDSSIEKVNSAVLDGVKSTQERINNTALNIGVVLEDKGLISSLQRQMMGGALGALFNNTVINKYKEQAEKEAEKAKMKPEEILADAYSILSREFEVELVSASEFQSRAEALRNQYLRKGTLEYAEYTAKVESILDSHRKEEERKDKEHKEKLKKNLDNQVKVSLKTIEGMTYTSADNLSPFLAAYGRVQKREYDAFKRGIQNYDEYTSTMEDVGATSYEARMKMHEKYLEDQERANKWSYEEQVAYYGKMTKEIKTALQKGLIDFVTYNEELKRVEDMTYESRRTRTEDLMNTYFRGIQKSYDDGIKAINDYYDAIDKQNRKDDRKERMEDLIKLEKQYANAVSKEGRDRLKQIQDEKKALEREEASEIRDEERESAIAKLDSQFNNFEINFEEAMSRIGGIANNIASDVSKAVESMKKDWKSLNDYNWLSKYTAQGATSSTGEVNIIQNNNVQVKNNAQASAVGSQLMNDFKAKKQMATKK